MSDPPRPPGAHRETPAAAGVGETYEVIGATLTGGRGDGEEDLPEGLLEALPEHLRNELASWIEQENRAGRRPGDPERRERARVVIGEWMLSLAQHRLAIGAPMLDAAAE